MPVKVVCSAPSVELMRIEKYEYGERPVNGEGPVYPYICASKILWRCWIT